MTLFGNLLIILGICLGGLGAAGFDTPFSDPEASWESGAPALFVAGLVSLAIGGFLTRTARKAKVGGAAAHHEEKSSYARQIETIRTIVTELDERSADLPPDELRDRIGDLLAGEYFDLTSRSDDLIALVGFSDYARVWEHVATAERLLARCWSMATDGYAEQGVEELPHARTSLDEAARALAEI